MEKPFIDKPEGPAPADLVIEDITVGDGAEAVAGGFVKVHYLGVDFETGEEFDSSWDRGEAAEFPLTGLIQGWQEGIPGMKVGGRRQLTIPPEKAYGPAGADIRCPAARSCSSSTCSTPARRSAMRIPVTTLNDGYDFPLLGLGTYKLTGDEVETIVRTAIRVGLPPHRHRCVVRQRGRGGQGDQQRHQGWRRHP